MVLKALIWTHTYEISNFGIFDLIAGTMIPKVRKFTLLGVRQK